MKRYLLTSLLLLALLPGQGKAATDPTLLKAKMHGVYMSTSPYCTSLTQVFTNTSTEFLDFFVNPTLGFLDNSSHRFDGSYPCLVFKMSERLSFRISTTTAGCAIDTDYSSDMCPPGTITTGIDTATTTCSADTEDTIYIYLSTASTSTTLGAGVNPFSPPTASNPLNGIRLSTPFQIVGMKSGRFVINGNDKVTSTGPGNCQLDFPNFSFVQD
jgi:hypothetical protein